MDEPSFLADSRITTFGHLVEAYATLTHLLNAEMEAEVGIPLLWYGVLLHIGRSPDGVRPMHELVNATAFTSGGVTRLVDRMERAGLVERRPCPTDRRVQWIGLSDEGKETLRRATEIHVRGIQAHLIDALAPDEVRTLDALLARLVVWGAPTGQSPNR